MASHTTLPESLKDAVIMIYLVSPRDKVWGLMIDIGPAGVWVRGMDLNSFDDWLRSQSLPPDQRLTPNTAFYPLGRIEKIFVEEADGDGSLEAQCLARTGRSLRDCIGGNTQDDIMSGGVGA